MSASGFQVRPFAAGDEPAVIDLWRRCDLLRAWNDPHRDIAAKVAHSPDLFLVGVAGGKIVAAVMVGYEGHRGWINYLAIDPAVQRRGLGRMMMDQAEQRLRAMGCQKINLLVRAGNTKITAFYEALGFTQEDVVNFGKRLS